MRICPVVWKSGWQIPSPLKRNTGSIPGDSRTRACTDASRSRGGGSGRILHQRQRAHVPRHADEHYRHEAGPLAGRSLCDAVTRDREQSVRNGQVNRGGSSDIHHVTKAPTWWSEPLSHPGAASAGCRLSTQRPEGASPSASTSFSSRPSQVGGRKVS